MDGTCQDERGENVPYRAPQGGPLRPGAPGRALLVAPSCLPSLFFFLIQVWSAATGREL